jgi:proteasome lid subunit RPN8/RPN11
MVLEISSALLERLLSDTRKSPDREICGLLFGAAERIEAVRACANVAADPRRTFEIDPATLLAAHRAARSGGPQVIGHYHSHPSGMAEPSAHDAEAAMGDQAVWLILTATDVRAWRSTSVGAFEEVALLA